MSDSRDFRSRIFESRIDRRQLFKGTAAAGAGVAAASMGLGHLTDASAQTVLSFYHDKSPWQDYFVQLGNSAQEAIGITWEPTPYSDTTSYQAALLAALPTKQSPDMFTWWSGYRIEDLYKQGALADVSDVWTQAIADGNLPESLGAAFTFDSKQYALPTHVSYWPVFYNKKVFADNGIEVPTTWDEFTAAAETLKSAGITPFGATQNGRWPSFIWFEEMILRSDPQLYLDLTAGKAKYTDDAVVAAMEVWKGLIEKDYFTSFDADMNNDIGPGLANGDVAMFPIGTWFQSVFISNGMEPGVDYDLFVMPNINPELTSKSIIVETGALAIAANAPDLEDSKKMGAWWVSPEAVTEFSNLLGDAPSNPQAKSENPAISGLVDSLSADGYTLYQRYWEASPVPIVEGAVDYLAQFMLNPGDLQTVLESIQQLAEQTWAEREG
ncbi:MAG: extracellular solute-binding protein [Thermomicrobiales bacterium]|nr:extracellular solute-binding protein [Thermomicrobiales bacterium]